MLKELLLPFCSNIVLHAVRMKLGHGEKKRNDYAKLKSGISFLISTLRQTDFLATLQKKCGLIFADGRLC